MKYILKKRILFTAVAAVGIVCASCSGGGGGGNGSEDVDDGEEKEEFSSPDEEKGFAPSSLVGRTLDFRNTFNGFRSFSFVSSSQVRDNSGCIGTYSWKKTGDNTGELSLNVVRSSSSKFVTSGKAQLTFQSASGCLFKGTASGSNLTIYCQLEG